MIDVLTGTRAEIDARMRELAPVVEEYRLLEAAAGALAGVAGTSRRETRRAAPHARRSRPRAPGADVAAAPSRGRPRGTGTRTLQTLELVMAKPGITIPEIASSLGIKQNYLYRVLAGLGKEGKVVKRGRGWHATT